MRRFLWLLLIFSLADVFAHASVCESASPKKTTQSRWRVDHYAHDASLKRDWAVLVDCDHPGAPARMKLAPRGEHAPVQNVPVGGVRVARVIHGEGKLEFVKPQPPIAVKAGAAVEVSNAPEAPARILLSGTAVETARLGQPVRVRLNLSGRFVQGIAQGPHSVELAGMALPAWRKP